MAGTRPGATAAIWGCFVARLKMAAQQQAPNNGAVPPEFLDHASDAWMSSARFVEFMLTHGFDACPGHPGVESMRPEHRFELAVNAWAKRHDLVRPFNQAHPELGSMTDWQRLRELGIRQPRRLRRLVVS